MVGLQSSFLDHFLPGTPLSSLSVLSGIDWLISSSVAPRLLASNLALLWAPVCQYRIICVARIPLSKVAATYPQKTKGSFTSCFVVNTRARHPSNVLKTAKAETLPVERLR